MGNQKEKRKGGSVVGLVFGLLGMFVAGFLLCAVLFVTTNLSAGVNNITQNIVSFVDNKNINISTDFIKTLEVRRDLPDDSEKEATQSAGKDTSVNTIETDPPETMNHDHVYEEWIAVQDATCTETGLSRRTCYCGAIEEKEIPTVAHTPKIIDAIVPTCTTNGSTSGTVCAVCGVSIDGADVIEALGHTEVEDAAVPATCTVDGKTAGSHCSVCGEIITAQEVIQAAGHTNVTDKGIEPTCTASGKSDGTHCSVCGEVTKAQTTLKATGHVPVTKSGILATCTTSGLSDGLFCAVCGTAIEKQVVVPATGHQYQKTSTATTCTAAGRTVYTCQWCDHQYTEETGAALGHSIGINGICSRCNGDFSVDIRTRISAPFTTQTTRGGKTYNPFQYRDMGMLQWRWAATNNSGKQIKYVKFAFVIYNAVGDPVDRKSVV